MSKEKIIVVGAGIHDMEAAIARVVEKNFNPIFVGSASEGRAKAIEIAEANHITYPTPLISVGDLASTINKSGLTIAESKLGAPGSLTRMIEEQNTYLIENTKQLDHDFQMLKEDWGNHNYVKETESFKKNKAKRKKAKKHKKKFNKR